MSALTDQLLSVSKPFLGPATESFLQRQCAHIKVEMTALTSANLKDLAIWVNRSGALIMDAQKADVLAKKIAAL
ncbi:MAG: hypothetical protein WBE76_22605 [Terracidiphilus sp.]